MKAQTPLGKLIQSYNGKTAAMPILVIIIPVLAVLLLIKILLRYITVSVMFVYLKYCRFINWICDAPTKWTWVNKDLK
ncbi:TPA: hypothetical protein ACNVU4_002298 [Morganella morganii]